ncbi:MAG: thioredoxin family protein, partial [Polyangiaceae bacterium]|nr:thioredoxin family protein [Polyangiaceae bacterium]
ALASWIEPSWPLYLVASVTLVLGLLLGAIHRDFAHESWSEKLLKAFGIGASTLSATLLLLAVLTPERSLVWRQMSLEQARLEAKAEGQPLLIDISASWCVACKELDKVTFADEAVNREAGRFFSLKIDATDDSDPEVEKVMGALSVVGLPTVVLFDSEGNEVKRFTEFVEPERFRRALSQVN